MEACAKEFLFGFSVSRSGHVRQSVKTGLGHSNNSEAMNGEIKMGLSTSLCIQFVVMKIRTQQLLVPAPTVSNRLLQLSVLAVLHNVVDGASGPRIDDSPAMALIPR